MRPVHRGDSPFEADFEDYRKAFPYLVSRIGDYCSFCERRVEANLAVEHIQPKDDELYPDLIGRWDNYLLGCVNCNSTKGHKDVQLHQVYLSDRDNTFYAFSYTPDGGIVASDHLTNAQKQIANRTLKLTGLDKRPGATLDENEEQVAVERVGQRMDAWLLADESKADLAESPTAAMRRQVTRTAVENGFFSVWMSVFADDPVMRRMFIKGFKGTAKECFGEDTAPLSPRPDNGLGSAGKI